MAEVELAKGAPVIGQAVAEVVLPEDSLLIAIIRGGLVSFPRGRSVFAEGDRIFALARRSSAEALRRALLGSSR
jgi:Trk K+ transport system NAD-binding subunit